MIGAIRAEFRKLLSIRSTYILIGVAVAFVVLYAFFIEGYKLTGGDLHNPHLVTNDVTSALGSLPMIFGAIIAVLLMTHEYRYNTIMYTLVSSRSRSKVLFAKIVAVTIFGLLFTVLIGVLTPVLSYAGVALHGHTLIAQVIDYKSLVWRSLFGGWTFITTGLLLATLIRSQIGAIVSLFAIPIFEQILGLLLKHNTVYLPFTAQGAILTSPRPEQGTITYAHAALVFSIYLIVGWIVAWILFLKRDAN